jgi:hypothetical protein
MPHYDQFVFLVYRLVLGYLFSGTVFALAFVIWGVQRIDEEAERSGIGFRLMIVPGVIALWPVLLRRWLGLAPPPQERNAHRCSAR